MRVIRFRVWDKINKQMIPHERISVSLKNVGNNKQFIYEQYTGLKDKNGKEIYGDDLVKICNHKCQLQIFEAIGRVAERYSAWGVTDLKIIKFEKYSPKTKPQDATDIMYFLNIFDHKHIEIIGNIHTTPELLEKQK